NDQYAYWSTQIRHRQDALSRADEALRMKRLFRDSSGAIPSAADEIKAVTRAKNALMEAEKKLAAVKYWSKRLQKEMLLYKGAIQRFVTTVSGDLGAAISHLGGLISALQEYTALNIAVDAKLDPAVADYFSAGGGASMSRGKSSDVA